MNLKISLRHIKATDAAEFFIWAGDREVTETLFWDAHPSIEAAEVFLKNVAEAHPWFMAIIFKGKPVGAITLDQGKNRAQKKAELGYVLAKKCWGQGITTEAVKLALEKGFDDLSIVRIEAFVDPQNKGSVRVLEKSGMKNEGFLEKYLVHRNRVCDRFIFAKTR